MGLPKVTHDLSLRVDLHALGSRGSPQGAFVLVLETALPVEVTELVPLGLVRIELVARDPTEVSEHLHPGLAHWVGAGGVGGGRDAGELRRVLTDVQDVRDRRVLQNGHRLVEAVLGVRQVGLDLGGRDAQQGSEPTYHLWVLLGGETRQRDVLGHLIAHHDVPAAVADEPARRRDLDFADLVLCHRLGESFATEDLQVPQPDEHQREDSDHEHSQHPQPYHCARR